MHTHPFPLWLRRQSARGDDVGAVARWASGEVQAGRLRRIPPEPSRLREHSRRCGMPPWFTAAIRETGAEWSSTLTHRSEA